MAASEHKNDMICVGGGLHGRKVQPLKRSDHAGPSDITRAYDVHGNKLHVLPRPLHSAAHDPGHSCTSPVMGSSMQDGENPHSPAHTRCTYNVKLNAAMILMYEILVTIQNLYSAMKISPYKTASKSQKENTQVVHKYFSPKQVFSDNHLKELVRQW